MTYLKFAIKTLFTKKERYFLSKNKYLSLRKIKADHYISTSSDEIESVQSISNTQNSQYLYLQTFSLKHEGPTMHTVAP